MPFYNVNSDTFVILKLSWPSLLFAERSAHIEIWRITKKQTIDF